jgi:hypothetical protein
MTRLALAEMRRVVARRLVRLTIALAAVGIVIGGVLAYTTSSSVSEADFQQRVREATAQDHAQEEAAQRCVAAHGVSPDKDRIPDDVARACFPDHPIRAHDPRFHRTRLKGVLQGVAGVLAIVGWVVGASLVGAEFASRGMTTQLTWEPRRGRVFVVKAAAAVFAVAVLSFACLALVALSMWPALAAHSAPLGASDPSWATLAGVVGRGVVLAALSAGIGFAVAAIGRSTAAALGAGFAYIIVLENILGSSIANWRRWLLLGNVIVFVSGENSGADVPGRSVAGAGIFIAAVTTTALVAAATTFRVRDVN